MALDRDTAPEYVCEAYRLIAAGEHKTLSDFTSEKADERVKDD